MKRILILTGLLFLALTFSNAQPFKFSCSVKTIDSSGFYKIKLPPEINQYSENNFYDIRIYDDEKREIPYLLNRENSSDKNYQFLSYEIIQQKSDGNKSYWVIRNPDLTKIDCIDLVIANAKVTKAFKISGSTNLKKWFVVQDESVLNLPVHENNVSDTVEFLFPASDYKYYRFEFDDKKSKPLNVLAAGITRWFADSGLYSMLPKIKFVQTDSLRSKTTWLTCSFDNHQYVDFFKITVSKPKYFRRNAELYEIVHKPKKHLEFLLGSELQFEQPNSFWFEQTTRFKNFSIAIENNDNATLEIERIKAFQWNRTLTVYLEKGRTYSLLIGNDSSSAPVYDIGFFKNKIPAFVPFAQLNDPVKIATNKAPENKSQTFFDSKVFVWIAIGIVICLLGFISIKMLKEMK